MRSGLLILLSFIACGTVQAQRNRHAKVRERYRSFGDEGYGPSSISFGFTQQFLSPTSGALSVTFPYTLSNNQGIQMSKVFTGGSEKPYTTPVQNFVMDLNFGIKSHHFIVGVGMGNYRGGVVNLGYGISFNRSQPLLDRIVFKAEAVVGTYVRLSQKVGEIDSKGYVTNALGHTIDSTFQHNLYYYRYPRQTYHADHINVYYTQGGTFFLPKFAAEIHPFKTRFFIEASAGWVQQLTQVAGVRFVNKGSYTSEGGKRTDFDYPNLQTTINGEKISKSPYNLSGVQWAVKIGWSLDDMRIR